MRLIHGAGLATPGLHYPAQDRTVIKDVIASKILLQCKGISNLMMISFKASCKCTRKYLSSFCWRQRRAWPSAEYLSERWAYWIS